MPHFDTESATHHGLRLQPSPYRSWLALFVLYAVLACALHYPGFASPMLYDSVAGISDKAPVFARGNLVEIMSMVPGRPLFMLTLHVNYLLHGMDPRFFRLTDALLSAATGLILAILALITLELPNPALKISAEQ